jgi:hypothetical protein
MSTRPGFEFVYAVPGDLLTRLIPFQFNTEQTYQLLFSAGKMRVVMDGGIVLEPDVVINNITSGGEVTTATAHGYSDGDEVFFSLTGTDLDYSPRIISGVTSSTFLVGGTTSSTTGTCAVVPVITIPFTESQLFEITFTQSADVMTLAHPAHPPQEVRRTAHYAWTVSPLNFASSLTPPANITLSNVGSTPSTGAKAYRYVITTANDSGDESVGSAVAAIWSPLPQGATRGVQMNWDNNSGATYYNVYKERSHMSGTFGFVGEADAEPDAAIAVVSITESVDALVTVASAHGLVEGDAVWFSGIDGEAQYEQLNDKYSIIEYYSSTQFRFTPALDTSAATWAHDSGHWIAAGEMRVRPGFTDYNLGPDVGITPPVASNPFNATNLYPRSVAYYQQRLAFGGSYTYPQTFWMSKTGDFDNMDYSRPQRSDDSITVALANRQVNEIRHLMPMEDLMVMTSGGEWAISAADDSSAVSPGNVQAVRQGGRGCNQVRPLEVGGTALFVQEQGSRIRNLEYSFEDDKHISGDLSIMAEHLFRGHQIVDWCYAEEPYSIVAAVRDDGVLLMLTYLTEQEVWGWTQHSTEGEFVSVSSIAEGAESIIYATVKREVGGVTKYFVERLHERDFPGSKSNPFCVDAGLTRTMATYSKITSIEKGADTFVNGSHSFVDDDIVLVTGIVGMVTLNDRLFKVAKIDSTKIKLLDLNGRSIDSNLYEDWVSNGRLKECSKSVVGLNHLEGKTVQALADGNVVSDLVVVNGAITLPSPAYKVSVGLGYLCDIQTLPVDFSSPDASSNSRKKGISRLALRVEESRGLQGGKNAAKLYDFKERDVGDGYIGLELSSGVKYLSMAIEWTEDGQVLIRQPYPLPATILALIPEVILL